LGPLERARSPETQKFLVLYTIVTTLQELDCIMLKVSGRFGGKYRLHLEGRRISRVRNQSEAGCLAYSSTLKMDAIPYSETSVELYQAPIFCGPFEFCSLRIGK
jgi:hypothetical protein